jgi:DNA-binding HxlR family transcriptional regulator
VSASNRVQDSKSGRPIMRLLDLLSRRWALRVMWELRSEPLTFRALRAAAGDISPTVLQTRLDELRDARLLGNATGGYELTALGRELVETFLPLHHFAERWASASGEAQGLRRRTPRG